MKFDGKKILITGGTRGIGRAISLALAKEGARLAINYYSNEDAAQDLMKQIKGDDHLYIRADISKPEEVRKMVNEVALAFSNIDVLINNAGLYIPHQIDQLSYKEWQYKWEKTIDVNLNGPANVSYCVANYMTLEKKGKIINISSRGAYRGEPDHPAYGAAKAGLNSFTQSLAKKLATHGISVLALAPGFVHTDMAKAYLEGPSCKEILEQSPLKRAAQPEEIAKVVSFLCEEGTEYLTGSIIDMNGASYFR